MEQPPNLLETPEMDIGENHFVRFLAWRPDLELNPQYKPFADLFDKYPVSSAIIRHACKTETGWHEGSIMLKTPLTDAALAEGSFKNHRWDVQSWLPLTISPSLLSYCPCNDHGFIKNGRWIKA